MEKVEMREAYNKIWGILAELNDLNSEMTKDLSDKTKLCISSNLTYASSILNRAINQLFLDGYEP